MSISSEKPKPIRVAIYTRKSVADDERKEFGSIEAQRKACEAFILSRAGLGWTAIEKHYDDYGFSGKDLNRDAFKSLVADCEAGLVDHVCCYRLDRLSRSPRDFADMNDKFTSLGIGYTSVTESFIDASTPMGRMMIQVILGFAQCERETSQERVKHYFSEARSLGRFLGGPTPYGYRSEKCKLYADPETAPFVERIFNAYIEKNGSTKKTAAQLNAEGVPRKNGQAWNPRAVVTVVRCPRYAGLARNSNGELIKGDQEPLIDRDLWERAQRIVRMTLTGKPGKQPTLESSLMSGILKCGHCGGTMGYRFCSHKNHNRGTGEDRPGRKRYAYFDCVVDKKRAISTCPVRTVSYDYFVGLLEQQLEKALAASPELARHAASKAELDLHGILAALGSQGTLRLAFLSPRIIRAVMAGQEPEGLSLARLRTITTPIWSEQERLLGI